MFKIITVQIDDKQYSSKIEVSGFLISHHDAIYFKPRNHSFLKDDILSFTTIAFERKTTEKFKGSLSYNNLL